MLNEIGQLANGIGAVLNLDDEDIDTGLVVLLLGSSGVGNGFLGFDFINRTGRNVVHVQKSNSFNSGFTDNSVLQSLQMIYQHCLRDVMFLGLIRAYGKLSDIRIIVDDGFLLQVHGGEVVLLYLSAKTYRSHSSFTYGEYLGETDNVSRPHDNARGLSRSTARGRRPEPLRPPEVVSRRGAITVSGRGWYPSSTNVNIYDEEYCFFGFSGHFLPPPVLPSLFTTKSARVLTMNVKMNRIKPKPKRALYSKLPTAASPICIAITAVIG